MSLKWILGIISFLIIASIVVVYIILSSYDFNRLKPVITQKVQDVTGRELRLGGDIKLDIGFTPALVMEDVSFQNAQWGSRPEMAKIRRFEVEVALIPLIGGNIKIKRLIFLEPDILIESDSAGRSNLDLAILTKQKKDKSERRDKEDGLQLVGLTLNHVRIDKGRLVYRNGKSGKNYTLMLDSLNAYTSNDESPVELEIAGHYNDEPFAVNGNIGAMAGFIDPERPWSMKLTASVADANAVIEGAFKDILNFKGLSISIKSEGRSILKIAELSGIAGIPDLGPYKATVKISDPSGRLAIEALDIGLGDEELIEARLIGSISDPLSRKGIDLEFSGQSRELKDLGELFDKKIPLQGPFSVSFRLADSGDERFDISDLRATLVDSDMTGSIEVDLSGKRPILKSDLSSNKLDLRVFSAEDSGIPEKAKESEEAAKRKERLFPQEPIPMDILEKVDADINIKAGQLLLPRVALNDLSVNLMLEQGNLVVKDLRSVIGGGVLKGSMDLRHSDEEAIMMMALNVEQLDIALMLSELKSKDMIEGKLNLDIDLNGKGDSVAGLMAGLNGKVALITGKGRIDNRYIDLLGADLTSRLLGLLNPTEEDVEYTAINCFVGRFDIKNGLAKSTALVLDTNLISLIGEGRVNLKTEELSFSIKPSPKKSLRIGGVGKLTMSLGELAKPLRLSGTLRNPSLSLDPTQTAITLGKAIGGIVLFGPVGIAAALAGGSFDEEENPCLCAIDKAKEGVGISDDDAKGENGKDGIVKDIEKTIDGIGDTFKKIFGR